MPKKRSRQVPIVVEDGARAEEVKSKGDVEVEVERKEEGDVEGDVEMEEGSRLLMSTGRQRYGDTRTMKAYGLDDPTLVKFKE